ncbi:restriction endonuclease subunit S domain-containing protein [Exercitatus varius]|uniref:hypothetical protein n=1 Tax=Exercitatus varius TaxID=67857 RepID=UPI00374F623A
MRLRVGSGLPNIQKKAFERFSLSYPQDINGQQKIVEFSQLRIKRSKYYNVSWGV